MKIPPAYQVPSPFGATVGGVNPLFFSMKPEAQYDSWLTVGKTTGDSKSELSIIGIDAKKWTAQAGLNVINGAVFWMNPQKGPTGSVVLAQLTVPTTYSGTAVVNMQGKDKGMLGKTGDGANWDQRGTVCRRRPSFRDLQITHMSPLVL